jgi:hypothetical protein
MKKILILTVCLLAMTCRLVQGAPMGTSFTYQGYLEDGGNSANGQYDLSFALFDAATVGNLIGSVVTFGGEEVKDGVFTVVLDFGAAAFSGDARWLEIGARPYDSRPIHPFVPYTTLAPRQQVRPSPYAMHAQTAQTLTGNIDASGATLNFGNSVRQLLSFWSSAYGLGVQADTLYFRSDTGFAWYRDGTHANGQFDPGANGSTLMKLYGTGTLELKNNSSIPNPHLRLVETEQNDFARLELQAGTHPFWHIAAGGAVNDMNFYNSTNGDVMTLKETGELRVKVLTITGGADVAEPFPMSKPEIAKGSVVVIDEDNPGQLRLSDRAYDTRVAGVVSGANGIRPGLSLSQQGALEGTQQVALTGRVYVQADASDTPIKPGDLLTTSNQPGCAMKVTDPARAQGAILGKAMTGLKQGKGLVLVLVTLQ